MVVSEPWDKDWEEVLGNPALREEIARRSRANRSPIVPRTTARENVPVAFSCCGKAGEVVPVSRTLYSWFRGKEFFATDTSARPGRATKVTAYVGQDCLFEEVPSWIFSEYMDPEERQVAEDARKLLRTPLETAEIRAVAARLLFVETAGKFLWPTVTPGTPIDFRVRFAEDCEWQAVILGAELRS